jgi:hypothetical protein
MNTPQPKFHWHMWPGGEHWLHCAVFYCPQTLKIYTPPPPTHTCMHARAHAHTHTHTPNSLAETWAQNQKSAKSIIFCFQNELNYWWHEKTNISYCQLATAGRVKRSQAIFRNWVPCVPHKATHYFARSWLWTLHDIWYSQHHNACQLKSPFTANRFYHLQPFQHSMYVHLMHLLEVFRHRNPQIC